MYSIGYDIGSSSIKASLVEYDSGKVVAGIKYPDDEMKINSEKKGWAEQDPNLWWDYVCQATKEIIEKFNINPELVKTIGIAYQMHGLVIVDENFQILRPSIIWCDSRAVQIGENAFLKLGTKYCKEHLFNSPANFTASKLRWVKENEPNVFRKIKKFMLPGDYIAFKFSGKVNSTVCGLSEGIFWDFKNKSVSEEILKIYDISSELVPDIVPTFGVQSTVDKKGSMESGLAEGTKITYRAGDQPNNAMSLGVLNPGQVAATGGTSGVVYGISNGKFVKEMTRINNFAHVSYTSKNPLVGKLLNINGAGIQYSWLKRLIGANSYEDMNNMAKTVPIGSEDLMVYPFGNGSERIFENKILNTNLKNINLNIHSSAHLCRATLEGIAFAFFYGIEILKNDEIEIKVLKVGNDNLFRSEVFINTIASLINAPIERYNTTGAVGAARASSVVNNNISDLSNKITSQDFVDSVKPDKDLKKYKEAYNKWKYNLKSLISSI